MSFTPNKGEIRKKFDGSHRLFESCWRQYMTWIKGAIDPPECEQDVSDWLDQIAAEKVNNPRSQFYIYG